MPNGGLHGEYYPPPSDRDTLANIASRLERYAEERLGLLRTIEQLTAENRRLNAVIDEIMKRK